MALLAYDQGRHFYLAPRAWCYSLASMRLSEHCSSCCDLRLRLVCNDGSNGLFFIGSKPQVTALG